MKTIFLLLISISCFSQVQSIIKKDAPKEVKLILPQSKVENSLRNAGTGIVGGALLFILGSVLENNSPNKGLATGLKIGSAASFVWGGVSLQQAGVEYTKDRNALLKKK